MRRGGPLRRKTRLSPAPLAARLTRRVQLRARRRAAGPEEKHARELVAARSGGSCEGCGRPGPIDWSHRVARSQGGPWSASNGLALCRPDHEWAHANPVEARSVGWMLRRHEDPATAPALLHGVGWVLLGDDGSVTPIPSERTA